MKQSQFTKVETLGGDDYIPAFGQENKAIKVDDFLAQARDEIVPTFIYKTIALLQAADLEVDTDRPIYVRCEETEYRLYKITSASAGVDDISLNNGATATFQVEYRDIGFVIGPDSSTARSIALFKTTDGAELEEGPVITDIGEALVSIPSSSNKEFFVKNTDNSVSLLQAQPFFDQVKQNATESYKGVVEFASNSESIDSNVSNRALTPANADLLLKTKTALTVNTFAELATTAATVTGMIVYLKQHTSDGIGGGYFQDTAGTITNDGWTVINNTVTEGRHWKKNDSATLTTGANYKNTSDYATLGANVLPVISSFARVNFDSGSTHTAGTVGTLSASFTQIPMYSYCILTLDITTTISGYVNVLVGSDYILDDSGSGYYFSTEPIYTDGIENNRILSSTSYSFMMGLSASATDIIITTDSAWAGTINSVQLKVVTPIKFAVSGQASDDPMAANPVGIKLTGFNRNDMAFGDRFTLGAFQYDGVSPTPAHNVAAGSRALASNLHGDENTALGSFTLQYNEGSNNTAVGYSALKRNTKGQENTALGYKAGVSNTTGSRNVTIGFWAGGLNLTGSDMTMLGWYAGRNSVSSGLDTYVGCRTGMKQIVSVNNTFLGAYAGYGESNGTADSAHIDQVSIGGQTWAYGDGCITVGAYAKVGTLAFPKTNAIAIGKSVTNNVANSAKIGIGHGSTTLSGRLAEKCTIGSYGDTVGKTFTAEEFFSSFIVRYSLAAPATDTTPSAASIISMIAGAENLTCYDLYFQNVSSHTITLAAGAGVTLSGAITIASNKVRLLKVRVEGSSVTIYPIFTADI